MREGEEDGNAYWFVEKLEMEQDIVDGNYANRGRVTVSRVRADIGDEAFQQNDLSLGRSVDRTVVSFLFFELFRLPLPGK